jgi:hypothetical protein
MKDVISVNSHFSAHDNALNSLFLMVEAVPAAPSFCEEIRVLF